MYLRFLDQCRVPPRNEGASTQSHYTGRGTEFSQQFAQRCSLGSAEFSLSGIPKNLFDGPSFSKRNPVIQVFERQTQPAAQGSTHGSLASSHKTYEKHGSRFAPSRRTARGTRTRSSCRGSRFTATVVHPASPMIQRFLRWILPLKESNLTEDAASPIVPAKALPARATKEVCSGCRRKSFSTCPWTERATTSIEA